MDQQGFVRLAIVALGIVVASFVVLGLSRLVVGYRTAQVIAAPIGLLGFGLVCYLFVRATLSAVGLWKIDGEEPETSR
ncbi:hypothetical protein OB955_10855 [Halobacteria archaeon AArc-m2/3/4]|uniref:Uncharacterized protein n=1 Tax=Natronoglomus mannanivorans TaxID=2979990 RepID=A0AAP3E1N4_9EURY|nr:hypothetical protein [Halobacteria archaeon AArc-xg1-1]MCU4973242.1 hypothetical protein [Halobacteria archaeon AArc-m2/3/4]